MITAPRNALPKLLTVKLGTSEAASMIINAFITRANRPKVNTDKGAVKNHSTGRMNAFIIPSTVAAIRNDTRLSAFMPGKISVAKPRPMTVANQVINKAVIILFGQILKASQPEVVAEGCISVKKGFVFYRQRIPLQPL